MTRRGNEGQVVKDRDDKAFKRKREKKEGRQKHNSLQNVVDGRIKVEKKEESDGRRRDEK